MSTLASEQTGLEPVPSQESVNEVRSLTCLDSAINARLDWMDKGELIVDVPKDVAIGKLLVNEGECSDVNDTEQQKALTSLVKPICLVIYYEVNQPKAGIQFVLPDRNHPRRTPRKLSA